MTAQTISSTASAIAEAPSRQETLPLEAGGGGRKPAKRRPPKREAWRQKPSEDRIEGYFQSQMRAQALAPRVAAPDHHRRPAGHPLRIPRAGRSADGQQRLPLRRRRPQRPVPAYRPPLHHASTGGRRHPGVDAHGRAVHRRGGAARRPRRHRRGQGEAGADVWARNRRDRGRRLQAGDHLQVPRRSAGGELPEDGDGHRPRLARDPRQARRPPAQHAHARRDAAGEAPPDRPRNTRLLRAHRQPPRHEPGARGVRGAGVPSALSAARGPHPARRRFHAQPPPIDGGGTATLHRRGAAAGEHRRQRGGAAPPRSTPSIGR